MLPVILKTTLKRFSVNDNETSNILFINQSHNRDIASQTEEPIKKEEGTKTKNEGAFDVGTRPLAKTMQSICIQITDRRKKRKY